jgi:NAD(P)H-dependent flavin oxidoreductase YrpB (nitropropane dioxygenase family)
VARPSIRTAICDLFSIRYPVIAFSNSARVVAEVSKAGGLGVLGTGVASLDELRERLDWLDSEVPGRYGVDVLFPVRGPDLDEDEVIKGLPAAHVQFVSQLMDQLGLTAPTEVGHKMYGGGHVLTYARAVELTTISLDHDLACFATAIGTTPPDLSSRLAEKSVPVIGMAGTTQHARKQAEAGAAVVVAQGTEAAGHTGDVSTLVLVPEVVDAVAPVPVLAAGGIGSGRQFAAALALGAQGVWTGSMWLTTNEYGLEPALTRRLLNATSRDTVRTRALSGKPVRMLRNDWLKAWESADSPAPLPSPQQGLLVRDAMAAALEQKSEAVMSTPLGQVVGQLNEVRDVKVVFDELVEQCLEALDRLDHLGVAE